MRDRPIILGYGNLLFGFDADFAAFTEQGMAEVDWVFQDTLDCRIVPQVGCACRAFRTEIIAK